MYSVAEFGMMIADEVRTSAYAGALRQAVKLDSVVVDIGTGTGIFALLACQFGARRVYAIEPSEPIEVARGLARDNGYADQIEFIQNLSTRVSLPEKGHVIISDLHGLLPLCKTSILSLIDARRRLLAPGGVLIPRRDILRAAVVEAPELYSRITAAERNPYGLNMRAARHFVVNTWTKGRVLPGQLLTASKCWATLDYTTIDSPDLAAEVSFQVTRSGTAHGLNIWFDSDLAEGYGFSNAPGLPELVYAAAFFPWCEPVEVETGDKVRVTLQANLIGEDYIWRWAARVWSGDNPDNVKAEFQQSTFLGEPLSPQRMRKRADRHVPQLNEEGEIDHLILSLMKGQLSVGEIATQVIDQFPGRCRGRSDALARVGEISQKYSQ
jgi:protein arginine N-methyltransferase 1